MKTCMVSIDVEEDLDQRTFEGIEKLDRILKLFDEFNISATLFATGEVLEKYPGLIAAWSKKYEIACHGYHHVPLNELPNFEREKQLGDFCRLYERILGTKPKGFRAVQHTVDNTQLKLLEESGFKYDSSVIPRYVPFKKYIGFRGKAPTKLYYPSYKDYKKKGNMKIVEVPVTPLMFGIPLYGTWLRVFGAGFYKSLLALKKPEFISLAMHSWDAVEYKGAYSQNTGQKFLKILKIIIQNLESHGYIFTNGDRLIETFTRTGLN